MKSLAQFHFIDERSHNLEMYKLFKILQDSLMTEMRLFQKLLWLRYIF